MLLHAQNHEIQRRQLQLAQVKDSAHYVDLLNALSVLYLPKYLDSSYWYVNKAREIADRLHYDRGKADAAMRLGNYYVLRSNTYLSYRCYLDALQGYEALGDSMAIAQVYANFANYYHYDRAQPMAVHYLNKAMQLAFRLQKDSLRAQVLSFYYSIYSNDTTRLDSARWALATARRLAERAREERILTRIRLYEANELFRNGDMAGAEKLLREMIDYTARRDYNYLAMYASMQLAGFKSALKQADSLQYYALGVTYGVKGGYYELQLPYAMKLYDWYSRQGQPTEAARYSRLMLDVLEKNEAIKSQGELDYIAYFMQQQNLQSLRMKHDYQQQLLENRQLESRNRLILLLFLGILLVLLLLLMINFYKAYRRSERNAAQLAEMNREITEKNALLKTHDDFKNKLISLVAHDFRLPLINIIEITGLLKNHSLDLEEAAALITRVESSSRDTLQIFDNILRWINSQLSGYVPAPEPCQLSCMIREALDNVASIIADRQLQVATDIPAGLQVLADREMLQFVHRNFIHNAVKFSPRGGALLIKATAQDGAVTLSVSDEGAGIPEDILPHLFEYRKDDRPGRAKQQGAGLALIICKDFMDKMGGRLQAANNPGKGATLSYTMPQAL